MLGEPLLGVAWQQVIQQAFSPRQDDGHEISLINGRKVNVAINSLKNGLGEIILLNDLTETRALQAELSHHQHLLAMGEMSAELAHQIRTPLASALLYASHLKNQNLSVGKREHFANALVSRLQHLEQLIKNMLLFAKNGELVLETVDLKALLADIEKMYARKIKSAGIHFKIQNHFPISMIRANFSALSAAIENLMDNALELTSAPLKLTLTIRLDDLNQVNILLQDNGTGMSSDTLEKAERPFFTTKSAGTGLGLAVVQAVSQAHGGRMILSSELGIGTAIGLSFPYQKITSTE